MNNDSPLVSVSCITYNHNKYIRECLDGFLMQKTTFPIEVIIHDDCSTDGTKEIIEEYAAKYPNIIFPMFQKENQYSKGIKPNWEFNFPRCRGKYIAMCEGDDYWTDPYKLQKQVDFLEANEDFSICFHRMKIINGIRISLSNYNPKYQKEVSDIKHLARVGNFLHTASVVFRKPKESFPDWLHDLPIGDYPLYLFNAQFGKIKFIKEVMGVYRIHEGGIWGQFQENSVEKINSKWIQLLDKIEDKFSLEVNKYLSQHKKNALLDLYKLYSNQDDTVKAINAINQLMQYDANFLAEKIRRIQSKLDTTLNSKSYRIVKMIHEFKKKYFKFFIIT